MLIPMILSAVCAVVFAKIIPDTLLSMMATILVAFAINAAFFFCERNSPRKKKSHHKPMVMFYHWLLMGL